jgi:hypothetical protein
MSERNQGDSLESYGVDPLRLTKDGAIILGLALAFFLIGAMYGYFMNAVEGVPRILSVEEEIILGLAWRNEKIQVLDEEVQIMQIQVDGWEYLIALKSYEQRGYLKLNFNYWRVEK